MVVSESVITLVRRLKEKSKKKITVKQFVNGYIQCKKVQWPQNYKM